MSVQPVSFANAPFDLVPINGPLKNALGHSDQHLAGSIFSGKKYDFEWEQIKRGTPVKEFLNQFFSRKPFWLFKGKLFHPPRLKSKSEWGVLRFYLLLEVPSSETVSFLRPFFLRLANTLRPLALAMRWRKPCLFVLFLREG